MVSNAGIEIINNGWALWPPPASAEVTELDLGCGVGSFCAALAARYPEHHVIGADVMLGRLRKAARAVRWAGLDNVSLLRCNGWELIGYMLPDASLRRVHLLCPDPWPKDRHAARRLAGSEWLGRLAGKVVPGGVFHFASDDVQYVDFVSRAIAPLPCWESDGDGGRADIRDLKTDFERGWEAEGKTVEHRTWRRR